MPRVLIIDDERAECELFADAMRVAGFEPEWSLDAARAFEMLAASPFDVVVTDLNMPGIKGIEVCRRVKEAIPNLPVVVVTAFGSVDTAVEAMKAGAYDFVTKPFDVDAVALVLRRAVDHHALRSEVDALRRVVDKSNRFGKLLGTSQAMRSVYALIDRLKDVDSTVLVTGETGTGKELVAREIHARGPTPEGPFVAVNCAAMPEPLLENELFGHVKGAFTDARSDRDGLFVAADGGTLFLDEIADLPLALQGKLLRVLQDRCVRPVGAVRETPFETRVITATNRDLEAMMATGRMREDLFYRINVLQVELPPLRARGGDILLLAQSFLGEAAIRNGRAIRGFGSPAADQLVTYNWPGNVRELHNCVERAVALTRGERVELEDLPRRIREYRSRHVLIAGDDPSELAPLEEMERKYILRVVEACQGNKSRAAKVLGIGRKTLYRKLESFGYALNEDESDPPSVASSWRVSDDSE